MAGFIDSAVQDIDNRLKELKEEEARLLAAREALAGTARRGPGRPPRSASSASSASTAGSASSPSTSTRSRGGARRGPGRPRGRRGGNTRSAQALELVRNQPGITIPEIATAMKIEPNYLYRVMPKLTSDGVVRRDGQGWHAVEQSA
ncbi:MAG TPA: hypothetical protein VHV75_14815 [Solirubrobacteraceae bacterium]|jgi:hypothetical protein|nr:hypothetical protein [Solirubrobacteraceae bacterium]